LPPSTAWPHIQCGLEVGDPEIEAVLGPAMVEAELLPHGDSEYERFAGMPRKQVV